MQTQVSETPVGNHHDDGYALYLDRLQSRFDSLASDQLFTTDVDKCELWNAYLEAFPESQRQYHNCSACREFIKRFGTLAVIEAGRVVPAFWDGELAPALYEPSIAALAKLVKRARVTGVFLSKEATWGRPETGVWRHLAVRSTRIFKHPLLTAVQAMAEKREDFAQVMRAIDEFSVDTVGQAVTLLRSESLYRSEKVLGVAEWLDAIHSSIAKNPSGRANTVWGAVAMAPAGFCHPRSSMIGTLLEDIASGMSFADVSERFARKMDPTRYQRPQAAPSAGNIEAAEKVVEKLGIARSLKRRFARLEEIETVWRPKPEEKPRAGGGVFGHLTPKEATPAVAMDVPAKPITWAKFSSTVLPVADEIELMVRYVDNFSALVTAADVEAPPILQWDRPERRNPVSQYVYRNGSPAGQWGLKTGWNTVTGIALRPSHWYGENPPNHQNGVLFILEGAVDERDSGLALFPEILRSELHGIRSTIEAFSHAGKLEGRAEGSACGLSFGGGQKNSSVWLRVRQGSTTLEYTLDRWD
jgi:hypothetical protein